MLIEAAQILGNADDVVRTRNELRHALVVLLSRLAP